MKTRPVLLIVIIVMVFDVVGSQDELYPFSCMSAFPEFDAYQGIEGYDIWTGYDNGGFDVPDDIRRYKIIRSDEWELWVYQADSTPESLYVLPFDHPFTPDEWIDTGNGGGYYAYHPCAAAEISRVDYFLAVSETEDHSE